MYSISIRRNPLNVIIVKVILYHYTAVVKKCRVHNEKQVDA